MATCIGNSKWPVPCCMAIIHRNVHGSSLFDNNIPSYLNCLNNCALLNMIVVNCLISPWNAYTHSDALRSKSATQNSYVQRICLTRTFSAQVMFEVIMSLVARLTIVFSLQVGPDPGIGPGRSNVASVRPRNSFWTGLGPWAAFAHDM